MLKSFNSLIQLMDAIPDEQTAIDHFTAIRWKNGAFCPYCQTPRVYHFADKRNHKCGDCRKRFSIRVGTIFHDSKLPLRKWIFAIWLITNQKKGIASTQLAEDLSISQKSAWFVAHRLRHAIHTQSFNRPLDGEIESDQMFLGGKEKNKHAKDRKGGKQGGAGKTAVLGMLERDGELRTGAIGSLSRKEVQTVIRNNVAEGALILTDEHTSFQGLSPDYIHHTVNHSAGEYVRKFYIHTNGIESVWALFKRQVVGTHHWLSEKYVNMYLSEMGWRFNLREMTAGERVNALLAQTEGRLTYKALVS